MFISRYPLLLAIALTLCGILNPTALFADATRLLRGDQYLTKLRPDHPRLFLNADTLPAIRSRAMNEASEHFEAMRNYVDALPPDAPVIFTPDPVERNEDGSLKVKPGQQGHTLFKYNGGEQAMRAAFVYLVTGEPQYLEKAKNYLRLATFVFQWTADNDIWVDLTGNVRINAMAAYDWIYNELTPQEREAFIVPLLHYIKEAQSSGSFKFRRTQGSEHDGNYGESALRYFAGIIAMGDGIDDKTAEDFLKGGAGLFVRMMDLREAISDGSGLLSSASWNYSFGNYPYATFLFLFSWQAAFGEDISERWSQMVDYPNWFDFMVIRQGQGKDFRTFGIGDVEHKSNILSPWLMYAHSAQTIHFYSKKYPDKMQRTYAILAELPQKNQKFWSAYAFLPFLVTNFDPAKIDVQADAIDNLQYPRYFFNQPFGLLLMRSGKTNKDTYASFRFGSSRVNHQHYDELSFVIYKEGFLALDAGSRTEVDHHHGFAPQSVAHNTILIHAENEPLAPFWRSWSYKPDGKTYYNHGGQAYRDKGKSVALHSTDDFIYAAGDATLSYISEKSKEVVRQFVYIKPDLFVLYDRVGSVKADQRKEILFHFQNEPTRLADNVYQADNGGRLFVTSLLPEQASTHIEGGMGREFWASGKNWALEGGADWAQRYKTAGGWRLEISSKNKVARINFLTLLQAAEPASEAYITPQTIKTDTQDGLRLTDASGGRWEVLFNRSGAIEVMIRQHSADGDLVFEDTLKPGIEPQP